MIELLVMLASWLYGASNPLDAKQSAATLQAQTGASQRDFDKEVMKYLEQAIRQDDEIVRATEELLDLYRRELERQRARGLNANPLWVRELEASVATQERVLERVKADREHTRRHLEKYRKGAG